MNALNSAIVTLFQEVFRGTPPGANRTWFVQGDEALDATLALLSAEQASHSPGPGISTIAAHVIHTAYYLELTNDAIIGNLRPGDWEGSWKKQTVTEAEWEAAKANLARQAETFLSHAQGADLSDETGHQIPAIANVGHAAYHLGAIRVLFQLAK